MSYKTIAKIRSNTSLATRIIACASVEKVPNAEQWVYSNMWKYAVQPEWDTAWEYALATDPDQDVGDNELVITDYMILSATQLLAPPEVEPTP